MKASTNTKTTHTIGLEEQERFQLEGLTSRPLTIQVQRVYAHQDTHLGAGSSHPQDRQVRQDGEDGHLVVGAQFPGRCRPRALQRAQPRRPRQADRARGDLLMANLPWLKLKLAKAVANGDEVAIKRLNKQISDEEKKRGKNPRRGL